MQLSSIKKQCPHGVATRVPGTEIKFHHAYTIVLVILERPRIHISFRVHKHAYALPPSKLERSFVGGRRVMAMRM